MSDWNEQAAPNNNLPAKSIRSSKMRLNRESRYKKKMNNRPNDIF
ncbi:hypothetical protein [Bacillus sp. SA1-12]|nr:hypothetical protein [Bacillus sp. SA1-12]